MTTISGISHVTGSQLGAAPTVLLLPGPGASLQELREFVDAALPSREQRDWLTSSDARIREFVTFCRICLKDNREAVAQLANQYALGLPWRFINDIDREGRTPLMRAIGEQDEALVSKLLHEGATFDVETLIHAIRQRAPVGVLQQLVNSDLARQQNREGHRALTVAAGTGHVEAARFLLTSDGSRDAPVLNAALCAAAEAGHAEIVGMILGSGEQAIDAVPALELAAKFHDPANPGCRAIFDKLLMASKKPQPDERRWKTVLDSICSVAGKDPEFASQDLVKLALDEDWLCLATAQNHAPAVGLLLDAGAPIDGRTGFASLLHHEFEAGHELSLAVSELFAKAVNERDIDWGGTWCIETAAYLFGNLSLVLLLKSHGSPTTLEVEKWIKQHPSS
jgi:ankyrin repeat protein